MGRIIPRYRPVKAVQPPEGCMLPVRSPDYVMLDEIQKELHPKDQQLDLFEMLIRRRRNYEAFWKEVHTCMLPISKRFREDMEKAVVAEWELHNLGTHACTGTDYPWQDEGINLGIVKVKVRTLVRGALVAATVGMGYFGHVLLKYKAQENDVFCEHGDDECLGIDAIREHLTI